MKKSITPGQISQNNLRLIYHYIYENEPVSQQDISYDLRLSRPTVAAKLSELEAAGLIRRDGQIPSEYAGRKAAAFSIVPDYRIAVGVEVLKKEVKILIVDLRGNYSNRIVVDLVYENSENYIEALCKKVTEYIDSLRVRKEQILGVGFAFPGLVNPDGTEITYGKILDCTGLRISHFSRRLNYPCRFLHDPTAAADSELWFSPELPDFVYLSISQHLGAAIVQNREILSGIHGYTATIEHIVIAPKGKKCYCGKCGCLETVCSMEALLEDEEEDVFFAKLSEGEASHRRRWRYFLKYLALSISTLHLMFDTTFVLGGYVSSHLTEDDIRFLYDEVEKTSPFPEFRDNIRISKMPRHSITFGAALPYIRSFLTGDLLE